VSSINSARAAQYDSLAVRFNGDTGSNYSYTLLQGGTSYGGTAVSGRAASQSNIFIGNFTASSLSNSFSTSVLHIMNYSNATAYKTVIAQGGSIIDASNSDGEVVVGIWRATPAAITSITIAYSSNVISGSIALYGVK
jgi:hypothetical protein